MKVPIAKRSVYFIQSETLKLPSAPVISMIGSTTILKPSCFHLEQTARDPCPDSMEINGDHFIHYRHGRQWTENHGETVSFL